MPQKQKGFTAIVNKLHIHAMRRTATSDVHVPKSEAQFFHVYRREQSRDLTLVKGNLSFDSAADFCLAHGTLH
ncbi:hypothetical protein [Cupriavidus pampae]|uniref:Uncharacterized protein n=1 Tax=Cupriavidus pampae TaxID=659251 RepID=A0ABM8Y032_9BURK|nr:hypothetical protein [Cupriavidus pampae]CAG9186013.1 hypothetical protein LMG32289_06214 [Cupriavidus pampae]